MDKGLTYNIGGKERKASARINTTLFLEMCRLMHFASDLVMAYKRDEEFRQHVDKIDDRMSFEAASMFLAGSLLNITQEWLGDWIEPHEWAKERAKKPAKTADETEEK